MSLAWAQQTETDPVEPQAQEQEQAQAETVAADGPMVIPASEAPIVIDSDRNRYDLRTGVTEFNDNVSIERGPMEISADRGVIKQVDGEMTEIELFGSPVEWRDRLEDGSIVSGGQYRHTHRQRRHSTRTGRIHRRSTGIQPRHRELEWQR